MTSTKPASTAAPSRLGEERAFLEKVYTTYTVDHSQQTKAMRELIVRTFAPYLSPQMTALELGCSDGYMTEMLAGRVARLDVVDGSEKFLAEARKRALPNVRFMYGLFEEFAAERPYDAISASYILEHVLDPVEVLRVCRRSLAPNGRVLIVVPNARALSRQLALHMGLIADLKALTENDHNHGHRRVYDRVTLNRDVEQAGFEIVAQGGIMLKILADFQMDKLIGDGVLKSEHLDGLYRLGLEYPDLCGSLFAVGRVRE